MKRDQLFVLGDRVVFGGEVAVVVRGGVEGALVEVGTAEVVRGDVEGVALDGAGLDPHVLLMYTSAQFQNCSWPLMSTPGLFHPT
ncbi:hypothetical protein DYB28_001257 [Aphanomyces astaci]|uniref:Uncharacterized protein n=1 Tax=Aphanomyces astaci TaxID=112090 RepID=A0A9X8DUL3_APHAT|nr:hypothetical protein DYB28_001257 [Aphanomyces astaci]